jgi:hypothetical protein
MPGLWKFLIRFFFREQLQPEITTPAVPAGEQLPPETTTAVPAGEQLPPEITTPTAVLAGEQLPSETTTTAVPAGEQLPPEISTPTAVPAEDLRPDVPAQLASPQHKTRKRKGEEETPRSPKTKERTPKRSAKKVGRPILYYMLHFVGHVDYSCKRYSYHRLYLHFHFPCGIHNSSCDFILSSLGCSILVDDVTSPVLFQTLDFPGSPVTPVEPRRQPRQRRVVRRKSRLLIDTKTQISRGELRDSMSEHDNTTRHWVRFLYYSYVSSFLTLFILHVQTTCL